MKKTIKRILAIVLTVIMILTVIPMNVFAKETNPDAMSGNSYISEDNTQADVGYTDSFGKMMQSVLTTQSDEAEETKDAAYFISDVEMNGTQAKVKLYCEDSCAVVVAVYDETTGKMLTSGKTDVKSKTEEATVSFKSSELPKSYVLKAFLVGENGQALCDNFCNEHYTSDFKEFMESDIFDYDAEQVINLDEHTDNNFVVLADDVKTISGNSKTNILVSSDLETNTYVFSNIDSQIKNLKKGDKFYFDGDDENMTVIEVKSVTVSGTKATIASEDVGIEEIFDAIKINTDAQGSDVEINTDEESDFDYIGSYDVETGTELETSSVESAEISEDDETLETCMTINVEKYKKIEHKFEFKGKKGEETDKPEEDKVFEGEIKKGELKFTADFAVKVYYKSHWFSDNYLEASFEISPKLSWEFSAEGTINAVSVKLGEFTVSPFAGLYLTLKPTFVITLKGSVSFTVDISGKLGGKYDSLNGAQNTSDPFEFNTEVKIDASIFIGIDLKPTCKVVSERVFKLSIEGGKSGGQIGLKISAKYSKNLDDLSHAITDDYDEHECNFCVSGDVSFVLGLSLKITVAKGTKFEFDDSWNFLDITIKFSDWYWSIDHGEFGWGQCPYNHSGFTFGRYPQSKVTDSKTISELEKLTPDFSKWTSYGYYSGTGSWSDGNMTAKDYMKYYDIDKNKDGKNDYRAVKFTSYRPYHTGYKNTDGTYQDDNGYKTNTVYYFKYEPLKWRILDPDDGLIMCETAVDSQPYNNYIKYANSEYWGDSSQTYYASNWEHSSIRRWLNEDFYDTAFNSSQKSRIKSTNLENKSTYNSKYDSANTTDKVFLLSYWDVLNPSYGFSSSNSTNDTARQLKSTDYAKCQGCYSETYTNYLGNSWWRLRSPYYSGYAALVHYGGSAYSNRHVGITFSGIVPALKISNLESIITSSVGSEEIVIGEDEPEILTTQSVAEVGSIAVSFRAGTANFSGISGNRYMLYSVKNLSDTLNIDSDNLLYINQTTADNGIAEMDFYKNDGAVTVIVGDFGNGIETRKAELTNVYTAKLMVDGKLYKEIEYNEGQKSISLPPVPEKAGYTGAWESYSLTNGGTTINAIYTPIVKGKVQSVSVGNVSVALNSSAKLNPVVKADSGVKYTVAYKSSDTKTVTVDSNGNVKGIKAGKATITCTVTDEYGNVVSATCTVTVTNTAKVKSVSIGDVELNYKGTAKLNPVIEADSGVKYTVTYKSSNPKVATVDNNGNVKGVKAWGTKSATITCTVTDEFGNVVTDKCNVTVGYAWWQWIVGIVLFGWIWY